MPDTRAYQIGSAAFRASDRAPATFNTDHRDNYVGFSADALSATASAAPAGGDVVRDRHTGRVISTQEFSKQTSVRLGYDGASHETDYAGHYVRYAAGVYAHPVQAVDPSSLAGALPSTRAWSMTAYDPRTGALRTVPKVKSAVDFGHALPEVVSTHRQDFSPPAGKTLPHSPSAPSASSPTGTRQAAQQLGGGVQGGVTMTAAERKAINAAINKAKFVLGYDAPSMLSTYAASCLYPPVHNSSPASSRAAGRAAAELAKKPHVRLGYDTAPLTTDVRDSYVRHPQAAYDAPVQPVDPSSLATRPGADTRRMGVTTATRAVRQVGRVRSAIDFGHEEPVYVTMTMGAQHTEEPVLVPALGAGTRSAPGAGHGRAQGYVPVIRNVRFGVNAGHPALATQSARLAAEATAASEAGWERALLAAQYWDNRDVAVRARSVRAGQVGPVGAAETQARVDAVVAAYGGQTLGRKQVPMTPQTTTTTTGTTSTAASASLPLHGGGAAGALRAR